MQQINFQDPSNKQALIMKGEFRFKVKSCYHNGMISLFKNLKGRFYDQSTSEWSFPNIELGGVIEFLRENTFSLKIIDHEFLARLHKNDTEIQMSFETYQKDFGIFSKIKGAHYDREMSKYIVPLEKLEELEGILLENKYNYMIGEDKKAILIFPAEIIELDNHRNFLPTLNLSESFLNDYQDIGEDLQVKTILNF